MVRTVDALCLVRIYAESVDSLVCGEQQSVVAVGVDGVDGAWSLEQWEVAECVCAAVEAVESFVGSNPDVVAYGTHADAAFVVDVVGNGVRCYESAVFAECVQLAADGRYIDCSVGCLHDIAHESAVTGVLYEDFRGGVVDEETLSEGAYPDQTVAGLCHFRHMGAYHHAVFRSCEEPCEVVCVAVEHIDAYHSAHEYVVVVFEQCSDVVGTEETLVAAEVAIDHRRDSVEAAETVGSAEPQEAVAVAYAAIYGVVGQSVGCGVAAEYLATVG